MQVFTFAKEIMFSLVSVCLSGRLLWFTSNLYSTVLVQHIDDLILGTICEQFWRMFERIFIVAFKSHCGGVGPWRMYALLSALFLHVTGVHRLCDFRLSAMVIDIKVIIYCFTSCWCWYEVFAKLPLNQVLSCNKMRYKYVKKKPRKHS